MKKTVNFSICSKSAINNGAYKVLLHPDYQKTFSKKDHIWTKFQIFTAERKSGSKDLL